MVHIIWLVCVLTINIQGQEANPCTSEQYYVSGLQECFYCTDLCHKAKAKDQLSECQEKCPDYVESSSPSTTTSITRSNDTVIKLSPDTSHITIRIVLIVSGAAFCVTVIVLLLIFCWIKRSRDGGKGQHELLEQRNPDQVDPENPNVQGCPQQNCQSNSGIQDTQPSMSSTLLISISMASRHSSKKSKAWEGRGAMCCVYNCSNRTYTKENELSQHHFFCIPSRVLKSQPLRNRWCSLIKRQDGRDGFNLKSTTVICDKHFTAHDISISLVSKKWSLKEMSEPSIFPWKQEKTERKAPRQRLSFPLQESTLVATDENHKTTSV